MNFFKKFFGHVDKVQPKEVKILKSDYTSFIKNNIKENLSLPEMMSNFKNIFAEWKDEYVAMFNYMNINGYKFKSLNDFSKNNLEKNCAYLRYDVHIHDILASFGIAQLNIEHEVPGVFYIAWDFTESEQLYREQFLSLKKFDSKYVHFGFHADPAGSWFFREKFENRKANAVKFINSDKFVKYIRTIEHAIDKDGEDAKEYREIVEGAESFFNKTAYSFLENFPNANTVTGHGNIFKARAFSIIRPDKKYECLRNVFDPNRFLTKNRIKHLGFDCEATFIGRQGKSNGLGFCVFDGRAVEIYKQKLTKRIHVNNPIVFVFHPSRWQERCFANRFNDFMGQKTVSNVKKNSMKLRTGLGIHKKILSIFDNTIDDDSSLQNQNGANFDSDRLCLENVIFIVGFASTRRLFISIFPSKAYYH